MDEEQSAIMTDRRRAVVAEALEILRDVYPGQNISDRTLESYLSFLAGYPPEIAAEAILQWVFDAPHPFFPRVAELIGRIDDLLVQRQAAGIPTGDDAWAEVVRVRHDHGLYLNTPIYVNGEPRRRWSGWSHPVIAEAVEYVGGWRAICAADYDTEASIRARFIDRVNAVIRQHQKQRRRAALRSFGERISAGPVPDQLPDGEENTR